MHKWSREMVEIAVAAESLQEGAKVLDVGSYDVNGSFRDIIEGRGWSYTGLDITNGPNVDVVSIDPYRFPFEDGEFDLVISGSTMEHVEDIFLWFDEVVRMAAPGATIVIATHTSWDYHPHPVDCWRIMPDGMKFLVRKSGLIESSVITSTKTDILLIARKAK